MLLACPILTKLIIQNYIEESIGSYPAVALAFERVLDEGAIPHLRSLNTSTVIAAPFVRRRAMRSLTIDDDSQDPPLQDIVKDINAHCPSLVRLSLCALSVTSEAILELVRIPQIEHVHIRLFFPSADLITYEVCVV